MSKNEKTAQFTEKDLQLRLAKQMYVSEFKTQSDIAQVLGVTQSNVSYWVRKFEWDKEKEIQFEIEDKVKLIKVNMLRQMTTISSNPNYEIDHMSKAINNYNKFCEKTNNKDAIIDAIVSLVRFIQENTDLPEERNLTLSNINLFVQTL